MKNLTDFSGRLLAEMGKRLAKNDKTPGPLLSRLGDAISICSDVVSELDQWVAKNPFSKAQEEIDFFKTIRPCFLAELLYYARCYDIHLQWPVGNRQIHQDYLYKMIEQAYQFFEQNKAFYIYCRQKSTVYDQMYFTRAGNRSYIFLPFAIYWPGNNMSTGYDMLLASVIAFDRLVGYFENLLSPPVIAPPTQLAPVRRHSPLNWTNSKVDFVSLGYSMEESGALNNGQATLADIFEVLGTAFNIQVDDPARKWIDICDRKKDDPDFVERFPEFFRKAKERKDRR